MWRLEKDLLLRQAPLPISLGKELVRRGMHSLTGEDYQYLHKSDIPSYHFQKSLRRLPIPKVEDSVKRYLSAAKVVLPDAVYAETEKAIKQFEKTEAAALQKALLDYDKSHSDTSYISEPWFDMYLSARVPVPVNFNPFMMYAPDPEERFNHQLTRATNFAISYARFKRALDANCLAPEVYHLNPKKSDTKFFRSVCRALPPSLSWFGAVAFKAFPLDMSQYRSLFNGNRIPKKGKDVLFNDYSVRHCLVIHKGRMFRVNIFNEAGEILPAGSIHSSLAHILKNSAELPASSEAVGSLTTLDRDSWAAARVELEDAGNYESLRAVDGALFALCLDDLKTEDHQRLVQSLLIGDDARNRWFDKCFQLIVDANGRSTINFEHSWGDGVAVLRLMEESFKDTNKHHFVSPDDIPTAADEANVHEIEFKLTDSLKKKIAEAQTTHQDAHKDLQFATLEYKEMTRDTIKKTKLSPDSIMQLAIQMAYYDLYKEFAPTYESCSTAAFLKGRTECIRSATAATNAAALAILEGKKDVRPLLEAVSAAHGQLVKDASMGQGFDRHLLGLKITAQRAGQPIPSFYDDAGYKRMGHFILSTSTLSTETIVFGGFGPVVADGFGIGYNVVKNMLGAVISCNKSKRDAEEFSRAMYRSLDLLKAVFESEQAK